MCSDYTILLFLCNPNPNVELSVLLFLSISLFYPFINMERAFLSSQPITAHRGTTCTHWGDLRDDGAQGFCRKRDGCVVSSLIKAEVEKTDEPVQICYLTMVLIRESSTVVAPRQSRVERWRLCVVVLSAVGTRRFWSRFCGCGPAEHSGVWSHNTCLQPTLISLTPSTASG